MENIITNQAVITIIYKALQYISCYHSKDFILAMINAYNKETNLVAKDAIKQILINSKMCAKDNRPICQDTGIVNVFVKIGIHANFADDFSLEDAINDGVRKAYTDKKNPLRASIVTDTIFTRINTKDNTPAIIHTTFNNKNTIEFIVAAKGCGSENKAKFAVLNPGDNIITWIIKQVKNIGAGWCPPGIIGIGVGGTAEKAMLMAKEALMEEIDITNIRQKKTTTAIEKLRITLVDKINSLPIGAQGLGGISTVLDVKIKDYPTHAASKPIALIANCAATRHIKFKLGDSFKAPDLSIYPDFTMDYSKYITVNLDNLNKEKIAAWHIGDKLLLTGDLFTARDAAHTRLQYMIKNNKKLPVNLTNKFIYYVGPVDAAKDEIIGPAGPTTAIRMDKFSKDILTTGILGAIGKAERSLSAIREFKKNQAIYLIAVGGAAYFISKAIKSAKIVAFADLGMEAIYKLTVKNMPVIVALDSKGNNIHKNISK